MTVTLKSKRSAGFTLVEIAVVVTIMAILLAMGLATANSVMQSAQRSTTQEKESAIKDALVAYFLSNHRFPCPDTGSNVGNTGRDGLENRVAGGVVPDVTTDCAAQIGTVPYLTLGIARSQALDGYGNFITYRFDMPRGWHRTTTFTGALPACNIVGINAGVIAGGFQVNTAAATIEASNAAIVLISHGSNGLGAWNQGNTNNSQNAAPATADELGNTQLNPAGPAAYRAYAYSDVAANPFDDIVSFLTVSDLSIAATKASRADICS